VSRTVDSERDSFLQAVLKLIPSEVIAVFVFIQGVMPRLLAPQLVVSLLLVAMTPLYLRFAAGVRSRAQTVVSTLSLVVWIFALGQGPFRFVRSPFYEPWYGSVALALWTLVPPMFIARDEKGREPDAKSTTRPRPR
jgi:hypothetical protein